MKIKTYLLKLFLIGGLFLSLQSSAQIVRLYEGFDNYAGTLASIPVGWHISWNSTAPASYYNTTTNYGISSPSYGFGINQDTVISPYFQSGDVLWFWCKGQGSPFSVQNMLHIYTSADSVTWNLLQSIDSLPVTIAGVTMAFGLTCNDHFVKFVYTKINANLAFDDVKVTMTDYFPTSAFTVSQSTSCQGDSICFTDSSTTAGCDSIISRTWDFGDGGNSVATNPCHVFVLPGNYNVWMVVQSSNGHADSTSTTITVHPAPVASFATNNPTANTIDFTDASTGSIAAWSWDFGDLNYSSLQNPTHLYASAGMYYVCLTVTSTDSCSATYCDSVNVIDVGINEHNVVNAIYISPNPAGEMMSVISNSLRDVEEIEITDVVGKRVFSERMETGSRNKLVIDISRLENGIYFLSVRSEELRLSVKFIVSK
jgi:hypothetical protein